jgi:hypothetical protein
VRHLARELRDPAGAAQLACGCNIPGFGFKRGAVY